MKKSRVRKREEPGTGGDKKFLRVSLPLHQNHDHRHQRHPTQHQQYDECREEKDDTVFLVARTGRTCTRREEGTNHRYSINNDEGHAGARIDNFYRGLEGTTTAPYYFFY